MKHPLQGKAFLAYFLVWVAIITLHSYVAFRLLDFPLLVCLADAAGYYLLLAGFGMSYYFVVRNMSTQGKITLREIFIHLTGTGMVTALILLLHDKVLLLWYDNADFSAYLQFSLGWRLASGMLLLILLILVYYLYDHNQYLRNQQQKARDLQSMLKESEMEMLKFQINPHFIFNSLNSISALTMTAPDRAQEMVIKLSEFFRTALGKERADVHSLEEEMRQMELYLEMEQVRFGDRLSVHQDIPADCRGHRLPALILQPLFENAIKHGVYGNLDAVEIRTVVRCNEGMLDVSISNTFDPLHTTKPKGTGIGLKNVRNRLELMYGIPDLVTIERTRSNYLVRILIPQTHASHSDHR